MNDIYQDEDKLKAKINFREVDCPCCAKCKWFDGTYGGERCRHPQTQIVTFYGVDGKNVQCYVELFPKRHNVCDLFETGEYHYGEEKEYWMKKLKEEE